MACCCGNTYCCCPGVRVPTTLHASISNQSNCAGASGTITLTWDAVNLWWQGSGPLCTGVTLTLTLFCCDASGNCSAGLFGCGFGCDPTGQTNTGWGLNTTQSNGGTCLLTHNCWSPSVTSCNPFHLKFTVSGSDTCCCSTPSSSFNVDITP